MSADTIQQIMKRPDAIQLAQALQSALEEEAKRRHAFRAWIDDRVKAEFINGETVYHSPAKKKHLEVSRLLGGLMHYFVLMHKLGLVWTEKAMIALSRNDYEPDIVFFGQSKVDTFTKDQILFPAPDLVVEILSKRTVARDRGIKKTDYAAHGIREYWLIDPDKERIERYNLLENEHVHFEPYVFTIDDIIESEVLHGFKVPVSAVFNEDSNVVALKQIMNP